MHVTIIATTLNKEVLRNDTARAVLNSLWILKDRAGGGARGKHGGGRLLEGHGEPRVQREVPHEGPRVLEERDGHKDVVQADSQHHKGRQKMDKVDKLPTLRSGIHQP